METRERFIGVTGGLEPAFFVSLYECSNLLNYDCIKRFNDAKVGCQTLCCIENLCEKVFSFNFIDNERKKKRYNL